MRGLGLSVPGLAAFLALWEAVPRLGLVNPAFLPPPSTIPPALLKEIAGGVWHRAVLSSLQHYLVGLLVGTGLGVALGLATGMSRTLQSLTAWVVRVLRPVPGLAWVPFAIIWFGVQPSAAVFIIAIGVFWIVFFATVGAVRGVDRDLVEVAQAFGYRSHAAAPMGSARHPSSGSPASTGRAGSPVQSDMEPS